MRPLVRRISDGSRILVLRAVSVVAMIVAVGAIASAIAFPLWAAATRAPGAYTAVVLTSLGTAVVAYAVNRLVRRINSARSRGEFWREFGLPLLISSARVLGVVILLLLTLALFVTGRIAPGAVSGVVTFVFLAIFVSKRRA